MCARARVAPEGGITAIYYPHPAIAQMFMSCELPKYYSLRRDTLGPP